MELKYVIPNMKETFGTFEFAGEAQETRRRINGQSKVITREYKLYSDIQKADDISVILPAKAGEKRFSYMQPVKLLNPKITAEGAKAGNVGYTNYILHADDMVEG